MISRRRTYVFSYSLRTTLGRHIQWLQIASTKVVAVGVEVCGVCVVWWKRAEAARGRQKKQQPATHGHVACAALPFFDLIRAMSSATGQQPQTGPTCAQRSNVANFIKTAVPTQTQPSSVSSSEGQGRLFLLYEPTLSKVFREWQVHTRCAEGAAVWTTCQRTSRYGRMPPGKGLSYSGAPSF